MTSTLIELEELHYKDYIILFPGKAIQKREIARSLLEVSCILVR